MLRAIDGYDGRLEARVALQLIAHVSLRPGELRRAKWSEVDFAEQVWRITAERMKMEQPHTMPLSRQSLYLLNELRTLRKPSDFLFPSLYSPPRAMSDGTLDVALRGWDMGTTK